MYFLLQGGVSTYIIWHSAQELSLLPTYLLNNFFNHYGLRHLFYTLGYNMLLHFVAQII